MNAYSRCRIVQVHNASCSFTSRLARLNRDNGAAKEIEPSQSRGNASLRCEVQTQDASTIPPTPDSTRSTSCTLNVLKRTLNPHP